MPPNTDKTSPVTPSNTIVWIALAERATHLARGKTDDETVGPDEIFS